MAQKSWESAMAISLAMGLWALKVDGWAGHVFAVAALIWAFATVTRFWKAFVSDYTRKKASERLMR
jgi:hypothetical protein